MGNRLTDIGTLDWDTRRCATAKKCSDEKDPFTALHDMIFSAAINKNRTDEDWECNFVLTLDASEAPEDSIEEHVIYWPETGQTEVEDEAAPIGENYTLPISKSLLLDRKLRFALWQLAQNLNARVGYYWTGGLTVDVTIMGIEEVNYATPYLKSVISRLNGYMKRYDNQIN